MKYRKLGRTGLYVSEISLGSWLTYGTTIDSSVASQVIDKAYELGVNSFDTANVYSRGEAEKVVGKALQKYPRESFVLATKAYWPMGDGPNDRGLSRKHVMEQVHSSLKRLNMDYVDIFYCHRFDAETPVDETLRAIDDLIRQGKILYAGVSEWTAAQISEALRVADRYLLDRIVVNQPAYSMLNRYIEPEIIPLSQNAGIGQIVFSPLAQGVLTGKYKVGEGYPENSRAADSRINTSIQRYLQEENLLKVQKLTTLSKDLEITTSQLALAWVLRQKNVASAIVGATKVEQLIENVKAIHIELPQEILDKIEDILQ